MGCELAERHRGQTATFPSQKECRIPCGLVSCSTWMVGDEQLALCITGVGVGPCDSGVGMFSGSENVGGFVCIMSAKNN